DVENDDDVPPAPIKRSKKHHIKISARNAFDDEVADKDEYNDEVADEDKVDDEDEWP
nr:hypothetical protein [Tanacetum cinerariifolium]